MYSGSSVPFRLNHLPRSLSLLSVCSVYSGLNEKVNVTMFSAISHKIILCPVFAHKIGIICSLLCYNQGIPEDLVIVFCTVNRRLAKSYARVNATRL